MAKAITHKIAGIVCDAPTCDYRNDTANFDKPEEWLNKPCPECGANLFTQADFDTMKLMHAAIDKVNNIVGDIEEDENTSIINAEVLMDGSGVPDIKIIGVDNKNREAFDRILQDHYHGITGNRTIEDHDNDVEMVKKALDPFSQIAVVADMMKNISE